MVHCHKKWYLTDPVEFLTFYSFLCNIGAATSAFDTVLRNLEPNEILASLKAYPWRVPTPPASPSASIISRDDKGSGTTNDMDMHSDDVESCASGVSTASRHQRKIEASAKEVSGKGTECFLEALAAQSRATNASGDDYLRTIESWRSSVSI